ncbi:TetR/AcrR family transcriptional regulator [Micromonospora sp. NPDC049559]|uniref:TetR/AcrR family transcriptional regulator n=1 Tax=Micromonospora sp. NPDC049559 TaxID=3155923 RepID=UPI00343F533D
MASERVAVLADAAIDLIADLGMRGLTHRAVDARAGLPQGTTSAYLRTRKALIEAVVHRLAELDQQDLEGTTVAAELAAPGPYGPDDLDRLAAGIAVMLDRSLSTDRRRALARYACVLEATHHPELRTILAYGAASRAHARAMMTAAGASDPARAGDWIVACLDGLLFDRLAGAGALTAPEPGTPASRADLTAAVRTLLAAFAA